MEKAFGSGAEVMLAHNDEPIPRANDTVPSNRPVVLRVAGLPEFDVASSASRRR
ncbi:hypothetical protein [Saccharopolyspora griseoalba]|uniref:Uncharacterized protein n=1 Tax=Saccharopolyspora griseoalba TaxID=1431848 RepID=A0ABW2LNR8_9PSEU